MKLAKLSVIAAIVLGGLVASSNLASAQDAGKGGHKGKGLPTVEQRLDHMDKELSLTADQKPKVKAVLEETDQKLQGLRDLSKEERATKLRDAREEQNKKLKDILTEDQYKKYQEMEQHHGHKKKGNNGSNENK